MSGYQAAADEHEVFRKDARGERISAGAPEHPMSADDKDVPLGAAGEFAEQVFAPLDRIGDTVGARMVDGEVKTPDGFTEADPTFIEAGWVSAASDESAGGDG